LIASWQFSLGESIALPPLLKNELCTEKAKKEEYQLPEVPHAT
jgi:hypothetical protein